MITRALAFGIAFGSASAAMLLIQYSNGLYKERTFLSAMPLIASVVLVGMAVVLFIKNIRKASSKPLNTGAILFGSLLVSLIMALCTIGAYQHIYSNRKDIMTDFFNTNVAAAERTQEMRNIKDSVVKAKKMSEYKEAIASNQTPRAFSLPTIVMFLSTGMLVSLFTFYLFLSKKPGK